MPLPHILIETWLLFLFPIEMISLDCINLSCNIFVLFNNYREDDTESNYYFKIKRKSESEG